MLKRIAKHLALLTLVCPWITGCTSSLSMPGSTNESPAPNVLHYADINWTPLNPARGDNSPKAGTLWGDRSENTATGFLVQFKDGFSSPPHIHNVSYRGIVIEGLVHNDDPTAANMWMPAASYWTQPQGEAHITSAKGPMNMAYIEIDQGPYLVRPTDQAYDNGERPINIHASNLVWIDAKSGAQVSHLWGNSKQPSGILLKLPSGFQGNLSTNGTVTRSIIIQGQLNLKAQNSSDPTTLVPGSYFQSSGDSTRLIYNESEQDTILYIRSDGTVTVD